ncbi:MAG: sulfurtransferase TusA family protein [Gemmataceae bacterium]
METIEGDDRATEALLDDLKRLTGRSCSGCGKAVCGHEVLFSVALGAKDAPRCVVCLASAMERDPGELCDHLAEHFRHRACYGRAWEAACDAEGQPRASRPACLGRDGASTRPQARAGEGAELAGSWDAGDMGCGDLVLALRIRLNAIAPGGVLQVTARDPAAPLDLPAWCRLTGHHLVAAEHPVYKIRRKET